VVIGVLKRNENRSKGRRDSIGTLLKVLFICSLFLFVSMNNTTIMGEGFFIIDEVHTSFLNDVTNGYVLCEQDGLLYLTVDLGVIQKVRIIDVQQPGNPFFVGSYELEGSENLVDFKIRENIAYMFTELEGFILLRFSVVLLNITDTTNPVRLGSSTREAISLFGADYSEIISVYKNYTYVSSFNKLLVFDCSNQTLPVKVANYTSTGGNLHIKDDFLYVVWDGVTIYSLADPVHPMFLGEVKSTKSPTTGSGVYGNYVINSFLDSGIQVYNCTDPTQPTICGEYDFPNWQLFIEGKIHDMSIVGDRLFTGGSELYILDISNPQEPKKIARLNFGDQNISRITVANNYMYLNMHGTIRMYSYVENSLGRNLGLGIGIGLPIVIGVSLLIRRKRR